MPDVSLQQIVKMLSFALAVKFDLLVQLARRQTVTMKDKPMLIAWFVGTLVPD